MEEAETQIRQIVKNEYLKGTPKRKLNEKISKVIGEALKKIMIKDLREASRKSLLNFYYRQYNEISRIQGTNLLVLLSCIKLTDTNSEIVKKMPLSRAEDVMREYGKSLGYDSTNLYATEMRKFSEDYIRENVKPVFDRLSKQYPFDPASLPNDTTKTGVHLARNKHINSLRNRAELEVRNNGHLENIRSMREQGHRLVIASEHADCSERCREWQGRVFSLDKTYGTTPDGRKYVPLEDATDIWYETDAGKRWKNGLLGFNCRHFLVPYKDGYRFPKPNAEEERKQYAITEEQRHLERNVRYWRTRAIYDKGVDSKGYKKAKAKAVEWNNRYIDFSQKNGRAYYPSRTKIL